MKIKKPIAHSFVLDELQRLQPITKAMFGCTAVYIDEKIVVILREREDFADDNGVWLATVPEHHVSLQREFPSMRSIRLFGSPVTGWQNLPQDSPDFEEAALHACDLIRRGDLRIGKIPTRKKARAGMKKITKFTTQTALVL